MVVEPNKAGVILIPISMILQCVHALIVLLCTKPEKSLQTTDPEEYQRLKGRYKKMLICENMLTLLVMLMNIIINYTVVDQIKSFDDHECTFK